MSVSRLPVESNATAGGRRRLPHRLRLLCIGSQEPPWALLALRLEAAGCDEAEFDWQAASNNALARLRTTSFDVIVICEETALLRNASAISIVEALQTSGTDDPIVVILPESDDERMLRYDDSDCEVLVSPHGWQSRALVMMIRRAVAKGDLRRDMQSLEQSARRGRVRERDEAGTQLRQLRDVVGHLIAPAGEGRHSDRSISQQIEGYYRELLRTYVMMGSGNLGGELKQLAELLSLSGTSPHEALAIHLEQVESLIAGLGSRSSRHVMARADLLALELMIHLGECYRQKSKFRGLGDAGVDLLHAESLLQQRASSS